MAKDVKVELRRKARVRRTLRERAYGRPRLSVFRSSKQIYAQIIDDEKGKRLFQPLQSRKITAKI